MKKPFSAVLLFSLLAMLLGGCGTTNIGKEYSLDEAKGKGIGVMLASMTQAGLQSRFNMFVDLRGVDNKYNNKIPVTDAFVTSDWACPFLGTGTEEQPCGRLAVIELPQGEYEFYSWHGGASTGATSSVTVKSRQEFSKRFKVTAGKVVYVGNVHFSVSGGWYAMKIIDKRDRDLPLFSRKYPKITSDNIQIDIIQ